MNNEQTMSPEIIMFPNFPELRINTPPINDDILDNKDLWNEFITDDRYKEYFISIEERWRLNLQKLKEYINMYKKLPPKYDPLGMWLCKQIQEQGDNIP
jgi:hypothetical protein